MEPRLWRIASGGPAAGLLNEGDLLVAVNGHPITTDAASWALSQMTAETPVMLTIRRNGQTGSVAVVPRLGCETLEASAGTGPRPLGNRASGAASPLPAGSSSARASGVVRVLSLGLVLSGDTELEVQGADGAVAWWFAAPPVVVGVQPNGVAARSGLAPGDVLLAVDGHPVGSAAGREALVRATTSTGSRIQIRRDGRIQTVRLVTS